MSRSSRAVSETARNTIALILRRIADVGSCSVAESLDVSVSTVSRWMSNQQGIPLDKLGELFEVLGIYLTEDADDTVEIKLSESEYNALRTLASKALET